MDITLLGAYEFSIIVSSCWIDHFVIIKSVSLSQVMFLALKSMFFSDDSLATLVLFGLIFVQYIFLHPSIFNLLVPLSLKVYLM